MDLKVKTFRDAGLEAKWGRTRLGAPAMFVRSKGKKTWWIVSKDMWASMQTHGIKEAFESFTLLGDIFSVPA